MKDEGITWPSASVAIALALLVTAVTVAAILRYNVDEALKIWSSLGTVVGILTGAVVTYFFTRQTVAAAERRAREIQTQADTERALANAALRALAAVAGQVDATVWRSILQAEAQVADLVRKP